MRDGRVRGTRLARPSLVLDGHLAWLFLNLHGPRAMQELSGIHQGAAEEGRGGVAVAIALLLPGDLRQDRGAAGAVESLGDLDGLIEASRLDETVGQSASPFLARRLSGASPPGSPRATSRGQPQTSLPSPGSS